MVESSSVVSKIREIDSQLPDPDRVINYGTAGFRANADWLDRICFRVGVFIALKARITGL